MAVVAGAQAAEEVRAGTAGRHEDQAAFLVHGHGRPDVRMPFNGWLRALPARRGRLARRARNRVPVPAGRACPGVERAHGTRRRRHARVVRDRRADDHRVADGYRRRGDLELPRPDQRLAGVDPHLPVVAEPAAPPAGGGVEGDQARVVRTHEDAAGTGLGGFALPPMGDTAADELVGGKLLQVDFGIEPPALRAGARVERDDLVEGRAEDQRTVRQNRSAFGGGLAHVSPPGCHVAGPVLPGRRQPVDVVHVDLVRLAVTVASGIAAVVRPAMPEVHGARGAAGRGCLSWDVEAVRPAQVPDHGAAQKRRQRRNGEKCQDQQDGQSPSGHWTCAQVRG